MTRTLATVIPLSLLALAGCGGGGGGSGYGGSGSGGGSGGADRATALGRLNAYRAQCKGSTLPTVSELAALDVSATKHAGYQALYDAAHPPASGGSLHHDEPDTGLALFVNSNFADRIRAANGGADISGWASYYEGIASTAGTTAIDQLWDTVYHRIPMMRHQATSAGYGDMALARSEYPSAGIPATDPWGNAPSGNGYATIDWTGYATPAIQLSYWPSQGLTGVPATFHPATESPNPIPTITDPSTTVGPPFHLIAPTNHPITAVTFTLSKAGTAHIDALRILVGYQVPGVATATPAAPTLSGDVSGTTVATDAELDAGEVFVIPPTLSGSTPHTWYLKLTDSTAATYEIPLTTTFTTAP